LNNRKPKAQRNGDLKDYHGDDRGKQKPRQKRMTEKIGLEKREDVTQVDHLNEKHESGGRNKVKKEKLAQEVRRQMAVRSQQRGAQVRGKRGMTKR